MPRKVPRTRLFVVLLLAAALTTVGTLSFVRRVDAAIPVFGIEWVASSSGPLAVSVDESGPGWRAGVRPGDILLRAGGREIEHPLDASGLPWVVEPGKQMVLELARGAETLEVRLGALDVPRPEPYGYLALVGLAFLVSGAFIALRWPNVRGGVMYGLLSASLFALLVLSHTGRGDGLDWLIFAIDFLAAALTPALLVHLTLMLSRRAVRSRWPAVALGYAPAAVLCAAGLWMAPGLGDGAFRFPDPVLAVSVLERAATLYLAVAVLIGIWSLTRSHHRSSSTLHRSQMRWLLTGLIAGMAPFVMFYAVPFSLGAADLPSWAEFLSVLPMLIVPAAFTAALARYRLHDLSSLVRRGVAEVTAVFFTFAVYAVAREAASGLFGLSDSGARYFGMLAAVVAFPPLRGMVRRGVDRAFYRERYSYRATLLDWARELSAETDLASLLDRLRRRVRDTLELSEAMVLVRTGAGASTFEGLGDAASRARLELKPGVVERLESETALSLQPGSVAGLRWARWLFAMKVKGRLTAVLATADREAPEEPLSTEDRALLGTLAAHAATAIEAARLMREVRQRAAEIEQLHARQERIFESSAVGLLMTDGHGRIVAWNRGLEEIYRLERGEATGRTLAEVFPMHLVRRLEREVEAAPPGEQARVYRYTVVNRAGQRTVVNLAVTPAAPVGEARNRVITFDDVTERVKLEEQVLRQERLASLGMLAAGVAHEVNTPLTGISSYTQLLLEDLPADDPRHDTLAKIETQTRRASDIVNSLLNLARPERGALESLSLNDTIREVLQLFEPQIRDSAIEIRTSLPGDVPDIRGHRGKLQQVLLNLLINARDAVGRGGRISVATGCRDGRVVVEVVDDGVGIAEEDLPQVFDPFFTTKGRGKGTGLGLSISYSIVQEHGGEMNVESTPGEFTRFRVELPVRAPVQALA